jgi:hypothetical protein
LEKPLGNPPLTIDCTRRRAFVKLDFPEAFAPNKASNLTIIQNPIFTKNNLDLSEKKLGS